MKTRNVLSLILITFILVCLFSGCNNTPVSADSAMTVSRFSHESLAPGRHTELSISFGKLGNDELSRQILVLSLYNASGAPMNMDGSSTSLSTYDLVRDPDDPTPIRHKAIQGNQAIYVLERPIKTLTLLMKEDAAPSSVGAIAQLDVFLQSRTSPSDPWSTIAAARQILYNGSDSFEPATKEPTIPELTETNGFQWSLTAGEARLVGPGTVTAQDVYLPSTVRLSAGPELPDAYICKPSTVSPEIAVSNLGSAYVFECLDGSYTSDPLLFLSDTLYLTAIHIYDVRAFLEDHARGVIPGRTLVLPSGTYFQPEAVGYTIDPETYSGSNPLRLTYLSNASEFRFLEDPINGTEYPVIIQGDAFFNCDNLRTVTFAPNSKLLDHKMRGARGGMFSGCDNLTAVYNIPEGVTDMHRTFEHCRKLSTTPKLPSTVEDLQHCFRGCVSLTQFPEIPKGVKNMYYAFYECTSLTGTATIPLSTIDPTNNQTVYCAFKHCPNLDKVCIESCPLYPYAAYATNQPVEYLRDHTSSGTCTYCKTINHSTEKVDGITIIADNIPTPLYEQVTDFLDKTVPDELKKGCNHLTLTTDLSKYVYDPDWDLTNVQGYTTDPGCDVYILMDPEGDVPKLTIYHELAHCYDIEYSRSMHLSGTDEWLALHQAESDMAKLWYDQAAYHSYDQSSQQMETFAIALSCYYIHPIWLMEYCPGMYAYVKALFP